VALLSAAALPAQAAPLAPTANTTIDVDPTHGVLAYSSIAIPAGVTVQFTGSYPVRIRVSGDATIDGELSVSALPSLPSSWNQGRSGPGAVSLGAGLSGSMLWTWGLPSFFYMGCYPEPGRHAGIYGSAIPFDLAGGSPGGWMYYVGGPLAGIIPGGGGGGTLVLDVQGRIDVRGVISADGTDAGSASYGSGGSILLRALHGCSVSATARVTAYGGGADGLIRIDTYDAPPVLSGYVRPVPTIVRLPDLAEMLPPVIGNTWQLRVMAPSGDTVFLAASFVPGSGTNAYGHYGIDLGSAIMFGTATVPAAGHDLIATFTLPVPNVPQLAGLQMWVQGLDWFTAQPPRYTQTLHTVVR